MKKILLPFLILITLFLVGCHKEKEYSITISNFESFYDVNLDYEINNDGFEYNLLLEDKYKMTSNLFSVSLELNFKVHKTTGGYTYQKTYINNLRKFEHTEFLNNPNVSEVELYYIYVDFAYGKVYSKSKITINEKIYEHLTKPPFTGSLVKDDEVEENILLNNKLQEIINIFDIESRNKVVLENLFSTTVKMDETTLFSTTVSQTSNVQNNPLYIHMVSEGMNTIVYQNEDNIFIGTFDTVNADGKYLVTPFYSEITDVPTNETIYEYEIDPTTMKIVEKEDSFIISAYIKDIVDDETYQMVVDLYNSLDMDSSIIDTTIIILTYTFTEDELKMEIDISIKIENIETSVKFTMTILFEDFNLVDITNEDKFVILPLPEMSPAMPYSELDKKYVGEVTYSNAPRYYKFELETGQYDLIDINNRQPYINIYDDEFNLVDSNIFIESSRKENLIGSTFIIPSDGTYYLEYLPSQSSLSYEMMLSKLDYKSIFDKNNIPKLTTGHYKFEFEGYKDVIGFTINSPGNAAVRLNIPKGNYGEIIVLYEYKSSANSSSDMSDVFIYSDYEKFLEVTKENQNFYFYPLEYDENRSYELEIEVYESSDYLNSDYNNMAELTDDPIIIRGRQGMSYLKFSVNEAGKYKFIYEIITGSGKNIGVFTKSDEIVGVFHKDSEFDLDIGDYYIKVESEYMLNIFKLAIRKVE